MFKFPYTNFQELNLDWIIKKVKELSAQIESDSSIVTEYINRLLAVEEKADNAEATATAADTRATGANTTANSALTLATQAKQTADTATTNVNLLTLKLGDLSSLYTTAKDSIVNAINEIWGLFYNARAVTNVTPAGSDPAVTYSNGVFTFDLPAGGDPDAVTQAELDAAIDGVQDQIDDLTEELDNKADVIIDTASGDIASFPDGTATPLKSLIVNMEPKQDGTGDPSLSNIRPIIGWTGCNVTRTGKNLAYVFDDGYVPSTSNGQLVQYAGARTDYIKIKPNTPYYVTVNPSNEQFFILFYDENKGFIRYNAGTTFISVTSPVNAVYAMLRVSETQLASSQIQLEQNNQATVYEPYIGNLYSVNFDETVYGGSFNLIDGNGKDGWAKRIFNGSERWDLWNGVFVNYDLTNIKRSDIESNTDIIIRADRFKPNGVTYRGNCGDGNIIKVIGDNLQIACYSSSFADVDAFKAYLAANPMTVCYKVADPVDFSATPSPINALKGYNNIWSDAGSVDVTYRADTKGYIDKLIAQVQALALGG